MGTLWYGPSESVYAGLCIFMPVYFVFRGRSFLLPGNGHHGIRLLPHVFQKYRQADHGESVVPEAGNEGQEFIYKEEKGTGGEEGLSYLQVSKL